MFLLNTASIILPSHLEFLDEQTKRVLSNSSVSDNTILSEF